MKRPIPKFKVTLTTGDGEVINVWPLFTEAEANPDQEEDKYEDCWLNEKHMMEPTDAAFFGGEVAAEVNRFMRKARGL